MTKLSISNLNEQLFWAAASGDAEQCARVLEQGAQVKAVNTRGKCALYMASEVGSVETCRVLLARGADIERSGADLLPLHAAAYNNHVEVCRILLDAGANIDSVGFNGYTALSGAAANDAFRACVFLAQMGADLRARNSEGRDALQVAVRFDSVETCKALVDSGMRHDEPGLGIGTLAYTAFQRAVMLGCAKVVRYFVLECGAELDQCTDAGETMEDIAADVQMRDTLKSLKAEIAVSAVIGDTGESVEPVRVRSSLAL
jgi:ankyrin repeat protein